MSYNNELSANNAELREILAGIQALPSAGGGGIPAGIGIKYIVPCRFTPPRTEDGLGFAAFDLTFTRENVGQTFFVDWNLQDEGDNTTPGYWVQHYMITMCATGNYASQHCVTPFVCGHGMAGSRTTAVQTHNYAKTDLTKTMTIKETVGSDASYALNGQNFAGLLYIMDSTYHGAPIVDAQKLSDFIACEYVQAGW